MLATMTVWMAACPPAAQEIRIATAQESGIAARDLSIAEEGGVLVVSFTDVRGATRTIPADDVAEIALHAGRATPPVRPAAEDIQITLTTGDTLLGKAGEKAADGIRLISPAFGNLAVKFEHVRRVTFPANAASLPKRLPDRVDTDLVFKKSGDRAEGTLLALSAAGVEYRSSRMQRDVIDPPSEVACIVLTEIAAPPKAPPTVYSVVSTRDGSSLRGVVRSLREGVLTFKDLYGGIHRIAANHVSFIGMKNGRVVYLSDVDPSAVNEDANYIRGPEKSPGDLEYPFQKDRNAKGGRIVLGGVEHRLGLGVRAHSELTYTLGGRYRRFQTAVGLDDAAIPLGAVRAEAWVDGKKVKEAEFRGKAPPQTWDIDVAGASELKLVITWAGTGQSDFADWGSARLIR